MAGNKVVKPVSFNVTRPQDAEMLKFVARKNFSGYVKKLIIADLVSRKPAAEAEEEKTEVIPTKETPAQRIERIKRDVLQQNGPVIPPNN